jgi:hypothetical protein
VREVSFKSCFNAFIRMKNKAPLVSGVRAKEAIAIAKER